MFRTIPRRPIATLCPYTPLFRSDRRLTGRVAGREDVEGDRAGQRSEAGRQVRHVVDVGAGDDWTRGARRYRRRRRVCYRSLVRVVAVRVDRVVLPNAGGVGDPAI